MQNAPLGPDKFLEDMRAGGPIITMNKSTGEFVRFDPHDGPSDDPLLRYVRVDGDKPGHQHSIVLYAMTTAEGAFVYEFLRAIPCHEVFGDSCRHRGSYCSDQQRGRSEGEACQARVARLEWRG